MKNVSKLWDLLIEVLGVSEEVLEVVTSINGYNEKALNDILYVKTGYSDIDQFLEEF